MARCLPVFQRLACATALEGVARAAGLVRGLAVARQQPASQPPPPPPPKHLPLLPPAAAAAGFARALSTVAVSQARQQGSNGGTGGSGGSRAAAAAGAAAAVGAAAAAMQLWPCQAECAASSAGASPFQAAAPERSRGWLGLPGWLTSWLPGSGGGDISVRGGSSTERTYLDVRCCAAAGSCRGACCELAEFCCSLIERECDDCAKRPSLTCPCPTFAYRRCERTPASAASWHLPCPSCPSLLARPPLKPPWTLPGGCWSHTCRTCAPGRCRCLPGVLHGWATCPPPPPPAGCRRGWRKFCGSRPAAPAPSPLRCVGRGM
jgi:hypothetical protein